VQQIERNKRRRGTTRSVRAHYSALSFIGNGAVFFSVLYTLKLDTYSDKLCLKRIPLPFISYKHKHIYFFFHGKKLSWSSEKASLICCCLMYSELEINLAYAYELRV
jgi:hypothetical protein